MWWRAGHARSTPTATSSPASRPRRNRGLGQRHHTAPELRRLAGVDVIFAHEAELPVGPDAIDRQPRAAIGDVVALAHQNVLDALRHQHAPRGIDREGAQLDAVAVDVLDKVRLAGLL